MRCIGYEVLEILLSRAIVENIKSCKLFKPIKFDRYKRRLKILYSFQCIEFYQNPSRVCKVKQE
jgi:hypothetical protein